MYCILSPEEQRQREEEERRLREEREREEQEERERLKAIEDAQFAEERNQLMQLMTAQTDCYKEWRIKRKEESEVHGTWRDGREREREGGGGGGREEREGGREGRKEENRERERS